MELTWYGHSFFLLTSHSGVKIATDPFGEGIGYMCQIFQLTL